MSDDTPFQSLANFIQTKFPNAIIDNQRYPWTDSVVLNGAGQASHQSHCRRTSSSSNWPQHGRPRLSRRQSSLTRPGCPIGEPTDFPELLRRRSQCAYDLIGIRTSTLFSNASKFACYHRHSEFRCHAESAAQRFGGPAEKSHKRQISFAKRLKHCSVIPIAAVLCRGYSNAFDLRFRLKSLQEVVDSSGLLGSTRCREFQPSKRYDR